MGFQQMVGKGTLTTMACGSALTHTETNIFTFHHTVNSEKDEQQLSAVRTSQINYYKIRRFLLPHSENYY